MPAQQEFFKRIQHFAESTPYHTSENSTDAAGKTKADICISAFIMELLSGFEPLTSPLPRVCSTN